MLTISIRDEYWDEQNNEFVYPEICELQMEHSLVSLSKWESKWHKPFFSKTEKTTEETLSYIECMTLTENVDPVVYNLLSNENIEQINQYIYDPMTATTFPDDKRGKNSGEFVTAELIYYWMIALNIPVEFQHWHINRLLTLIKVCNAKNQPSKKMSKREIMSRNAALNAARRKQFNSKG